MMFIDFMQRVFAANRDQDAIIWQDQTYDYHWLLERIDGWRAFLDARDVEPGAVVALEADYSPQSIALFLALVDCGCILVPLTGAVAASRAELMETAQTEIHITIDDADQIGFQKLPRTADHPLFQQLRQANHPGLVIFSSGSSGKSKAVVHDMVQILEKFKLSRHSFRTITFLLYDHIGGINTMLYTLANGGCIITVPERTPHSVLRAIEQHRAELLPTSPTFINLILLSEAYRQFDLSSLKLVTYGTEPMPQSTVRRFHGLFPHISLRQTYGLSEVGILRSKSRSSDSLWMKIGGESFQTRVVDGILHIKAQSAMLGYLNAPAPFTDDGWFITGDRVEVDGQYIKILGRDSEIINVGGEKVYPTEVESIIQELEDVQEVTVYGQKNPITGNIVCAKVRLDPHSRPDPKRFTADLKRYCRQHLQGYKVPVRVVITDEPQHSARLKKIRRALT